MAAARLARYVPLVTTLLIAGCQNAPSGPSVSFATPVAQAPLGGATYAFSQQPIQLTLANAARSGQAIVTYDIELAQSETFTPLVATIANVAEGAGGQTTVQLPVLTGNRLYFWRSRAVVGGVPGRFSTTGSFFIRPQVTLLAPEVIAPADDARVFTGRPTFTVRNAGRTGDPGVIAYEFQVSTAPAFTSVIASSVVQEQAGETSWAPTTDLPLGLLYWRARATDPTNAIIGPYSPVTRFDRLPDTGDQIDLSQVTVVLGPGNIGSWPAAMRVTNASANWSEVCVDHPGLTAWPSTIFFDDPAELVQGNQWMFAFIDGRWYGGAARWTRPGQACKGVDGEPFSGTFYMDSSEPLRSYVPRAGDTIGLMATTPNRFYPSMRTVDERTNVVLVRFGG